MNAFEAFNAGSLEEAVELAKAEVKANPTDLGKRNTFCEMLVWSGDLERADKQLETIMMQEPQSAITVSLFRQLIRGETSRQECFNQGRAPELLDEVDDLIQLHLKMMLAMREERNSEAMELLQQIEEARPKVKGSCDEEDFEDMRDLDDTCCSFFEVLTTTGKYYWIPFSRIEQVTFHPIETPRDLMWRRAHMLVKGGPDGEVFLPLNYAKSLGSEDKQLRLARATDWLGGEEAPIQGLGRRMMLFGETDKSLLDVTQLEFAEPRAGNKAEATEEADS